MSDSFTRVLKVFEETKPQGFTRQPSEEHSSERMGGWLLKDDRNIMIGFVGTRGDVRWHDYEDKANLI